MIKVSTSSVLDGLVPAEKVARIEMADGEIDAGGSAMINYVISVVCVGAMAGGVFVMAMCIGGMIERRSRREFCNCQHCQEWDKTNIRALRGCL